MINNTIADNSCNYGGSTGAGLLIWSGSSAFGCNNIFYHNTSSSNPNISGTGNFTYSCSSPMLSGTGNISSDPLFIDRNAGNYNLQPGSPCIDAGDPASTLDPDGTISDMGALYFDQSTAYNVEVYMTPYGTPIQIPASGGSFDFNIGVTNNESSTVNFTVWTMVTLPNGSEFGPLLNIPVTANPGFSVNRDRVQDVPATAPAGNYTYDAYVGIYPNSIWDEDHFNFSKLSVVDGGGIIREWSNWGEGFDNLNKSAGSVESFALLGAYPNPFNPTTSINYQLLSNSHVNLTVYDISGRVAAELVDEYKPAGSYEITFDASNLVSGVYFVKLEAGNFSQVQKVVLMK